MPKQKFNVSQIQMPFDDHHSTYNRWRIKWRRKKKSESKNSKFVCGWSVRSRQAHYCNWQRPESSLMFGRRSVHRLASDEYTLTIIPYRSRSYEIHWRAIGKTRPPHNRTDARIKRTCDAGAHSDGVARSPAAFRGESLLCEERLLFLPPRILTD